MNVDTAGRNRQQVRAAFYLLILAVTVKITTGNGIDVDSSFPERGDTVYKHIKEVADSVLVDGDMLFAVSPTLSGRQSSLEDELLWPNAVVFYEIDTTFERNEQAELRRAMDVFKDKTCVRFVQRPQLNDTNDFYVRFTRVAAGCFSEVGYQQKSKQVVAYSAQCFPKLGTVIHEMLHSLGFIHEQSRADRDDYVTIHYDEIDPNYKSNFDVYTGHSAQINQPYDYGSLMHYPSFAFGLNSTSRTIVPKNASVVIGQRDNFSALDLKKLNLMYKCTEQLECTPNVEFKCRRSPWCVSIWQRCDGEHDCPDHSDEANCKFALISPAPRQAPVILLMQPGNTSLVCESHDFRCTSDNKCLSIRRVCDGVRDCFDGSDENATACRC